MEPDYLNELLENLRSTVNARVHRDFPSVDAFAKETGVHQTAMSRYLNGKHATLSFENFLRIAYKLELDLNAIFPFHADMSVADKKALLFSDAKPRRKKVTVLLSETSVIEIKRDSRTDKPLLELKLS